MSDRKASAAKVAEAHFWSQGPKAHSLSGNRKYLLEMDARLAERFRAGVAEYILRNASKVDPDNRYPARAWVDGGDSLYVFASSMIGGHPTMDFAVRIPNEAFLQFGYGGGKDIRLSEQRSGKRIEVPNPLPRHLVTVTDVGEFLLKMMKDFTMDKSNWDQPGSAMPV